MLVAPLWLLLVLSAAGAETPEERAAQLVKGSGKACFCELGRGAAAERPFVSLGCRLWLAEQRGCATRAAVEHGERYEERLPPGTKELRIGYVGHWTNAGMLRGYLDGVVGPLLRRGLSVDIENTGCGGMDDPGWVREYVQAWKLAPGQFFRVRASQVASVGKWDVLLGAEKNLWAEVSSERPDVLYPKCADYRAANCMARWQTGLCSSPEGVVPLRCCPPKDNPYGVETARWENPKDCGEPPALPSSSAAPHSHL